MDRTGEPDRRAMAARATATARTVPADRTRGVPHARTRPGGAPSLAREVAPGPPGTLHLRSVAQDVRVPPRPGETVRFGRGGTPGVVLQVGGNDRRVSRRHGELTFHAHSWWLRNTGQQLVRLPQGRLMHSSTDPIPLEPGYTPVFVKGSGYREHLVELFVTGYDAVRTRPCPDEETLPPRSWPLKGDERLLLVVLGQRYLRYEDGPRPLTYRQAAEQLSYLPGGAGWTERRIEGRIAALRRRLHRSGFPEPLLHDRESGGPYDNNLLHNLIRGLVDSTTLVPPDLGLIDEE